MATITITQQPQAIAPVYNTIPFTLELDTGDDGTNIISIVYQLEKDDGTVVVSLSEVPFKIGGSPLDFWRDLIGHTDATLPTLGDINVFPDPEMLVKYRLRYGQNLKNKITLVSSQALDQQTNLFTAYGGALQFKGGNLFGPDNAGEVLSMRPRDNYVNKYLNDWLWVLPAPNLVSLELRVTIFYSGGNSTTVNNIQAPTGVPICFPIGPANGFWTALAVTENIRMYTIEVIGTPPSIGTPAPVTFETYVFHLESDCPEDLKQVIWREPTGGYAGTYFGDNKKRSTASAGEPVKTHNPRSTTPPANPQRSNSITNSTGSRKAVIKKNLNYSEAGKYFLDGLLTSNDILVEETLLNGEKALLRFTRNSGEVTHFESEEYLSLEITGTIGPDIITIRR